MLNELYSWIISDFRTASRDLIKPKNVPDLTDNDFSEKRGISNADVPELEMSIVNINGPQTKSSSSTGFTIFYDIRIASGDMSQRTINDLMWILMERITFLNTSRGIFDYRGTKPVTSIRFASSAVGLVDIAAMRQVAGFTSLTKLEIDIVLSNTVFLATASDNN